MTFTISLAVLPAGPAIGAPQRAPRHPVPPPVAAIYDPQPGPFLIPVKETGDPVEYANGIVANALTAWAGVPLQAFTICFRPRPGLTYDPIKHRALDSIAAMLKAKGAKVVVMPATGTCPPPVASYSMQAPYVEIMGVVRL